MNPQQAENLRILIRHMETVCTRTLDMSRVSCCNTPACALGEAKFMVPGLREEFKNNTSTYDTAERLFGLNADDGSNSPQSLYRIFGSSLHGERHVAPAVWAIEARKVLAENGYAMDDGFAAFMAKVREPVALTATV